MAEETVGIAAQPATEPGGGERLTVVLVDDDAPIRRLARRLLTDDGGFEVLAEADNGVLAIELARQHQPDVVLLDLLIPDLDGWEALPKLVRDAPRSMILVLSGLRALDEADQTFAVGAFAYLEKSVLREGFPNEVRQLRRRFERALNGESVWAPGPDATRVLR